MAIVVTACQSNAGFIDRELESTPPTVATPTTPVSPSTTSSTLATTTTTATSPEPEFSATVNSVTAERLAHSHTTDCPVSPDDVVLIDLVHWGFDGDVHGGAIIVARTESANVVAIFEHLFEIEYPIESVIPIGDLPEGIEQSDPGYNNTSGLHCRNAVGSSRWSEHASGRAIDINPLVNPYVTDTEIWPANSERYIDRTLGEPGMIVDGEAVVAIFAEYGWQWGGNWHSLKDYHHFSVTGR